MEDEMTARPNAIAEKSMDFAVRVVKLYKYLCETKKEFVLSKQLLRAGTSIGANVSEGDSAQTKADFISKMYVALKECNETKYWIVLLHRTDYLTDSESTSLLQDCNELFAILTSIIKTARLNPPD